MGKLIELKDRLPEDNRDEMIKKLYPRRATQEEIKRVFQILAESGQIEHYKRKPKVRWRRVIAIIIFWSFAFTYWMRGVMTGNWWF